MPEAAPGDPFVDALARSLRDLGPPGTFWGAGEAIGPMPELDVDGVGPISFPVLPIQAAALVAVAEAAPYGRGDQTLVDPTVRRTWQISPSRVRIDGAWEDPLARIVRDAATALGAGACRAELYKLLVYDPGSFFGPHRDTEKVAGMFATLVVCLPSAHDGGALVVRHQGREATVDLRNARGSRVTWAAFYADCVHELLPITEGYRVCLVYNLVREGRRPSTPDHRGPIARIAALLRRWPEDAPIKLLCVLEHHYTPEGLGFAGLKNGDAAAAQVLVAAGREADCAVHLAMVSIHESGSAEPVYRPGRRWRRGWDDEQFEVSEIFERHQVVDGWLTPDDEVADLAPLAWEDDEVCPPGALDDASTDDVSFTEATGNEGATFERTYRRAALVVWPNANRLSLLAQAGTAFAVSALDALPDDEARTLAATLVATWPGSVEPMVRARFLAALVRLGEARSLAKFLDNVVCREEGYDGTENRALTAAWAQLDRKVLAPRLVALLETHLPRRFAAGVALLEQIVDAELAAAAVDLLARAWRVPSPTVTPLALARFFVAVAATGEEGLVARAAAHVLARPDRFPLDRVVVPAAIAIGDREADDAIAGAMPLTDAALAHLEARIASPLAPPTDWAREGTVACRCPNCASFAAFLASPTQSRWELKVAEQARKHVRGNVSGADVDFTTVNRGSPHTLVAVKNQATFDRRTAQRVEDRRNVERLLGGPPPPKVRLWVDAALPAPRGLVREHAWEAVRRIEAGGVEAVSLGPRAWEVARALERGAASGEIERLEVEVHATNDDRPGEVEAMVARAEGAWNSDPTPSATSA